MRRLFAALLLMALVLPSPAAALTEEEEENALFAAGTAAIEACVDESMTDVEKLTVLHDWMSVCCEYGPAPRSDTAYGAIVNGTAVCIGYAEGYAYLARLAGFDSTATYSEEMDHAWILVTLDGERYFSDCTWDDGKTQKLGLIRHKYWLFDEDNAIWLGHSGWDSEESVPGGALEGAPWNAAVTRVIFLEEWAYYIDAEFRLMRCSRSTWETEELMKVAGGLWPGTEPGVWLTELYTGLAYIGGRLYFNTPYEICSVGLDGKNARTVLRPDTKERQIYGITVRNGRLCYSMSSGPDEVVYDVVVIDRPVVKAWGYETVSPFRVPDVSG